MTAIVPKFRPRADVILWGERVFLRPKVDDAEWKAVDYTEGFMVAAVNTCVDP